mgnify:CR=1 FL=1
MSDMMNIWDIVVIGIVAVAVVGAVLLSIRTKRKGRSCCGECARCNGYKKDGCEEHKAEMK